MTLETVVFDLAADGVPEKRQWLMGADGVPLVRCDCGILSRMANHLIRADGTVKGSIGCPRSRPCGFHVWGVLDGWEDDR